MAEGIPDRLPLFGGLRQCGSTVLALQRQDLLCPIRLLHSWPFLSYVSRLPARLAPTLFPRRAPAALFAREAVRGRRLRGISGVFLARCQLPFQIGDLLFGIGNLLLGVGDLLIPFRYLLTKFLDLTLLPLDLPLQFFLTCRMRVRMPTRHCPLLTRAPRGSCIHPPYVKLFGEICPEKSNGIFELPHKNQGVNSYYFKDKAKQKIDEAADAAKTASDKVIGKSKDVAHDAGKKIKDGGKQLQDA